MSRTAYCVQSYDQRGEVHGSVTGHEVHIVGVVCFLGMNVVVVYVLPPDSRIFLQRRMLVCKQIS